MFKITETNEPMDVHKKLLKMCQYCPLISAFDILQSSSSRLCTLSNNTLSKQSSCSDEDSTRTGF